MDTTLEQLTTEVRARVTALGYELVDLRARGSGRRPGVQIRIDQSDAVPGHGITVDECAHVSRCLETWLDATQLLGPRYLLEVSSPGIERPIRWREHWTRYTGEDVRVRVGGLGRIRATIVRVLTDPDAVVLRPAGADREITVPLEEARDATLVVDWSDIGRSLSERRRT